jgi:hypothetical protein
MNAPAHFFHNALNSLGVYANAALRHDRNENNRLALSVVAAATASTDVPRIAAMVSTTRVTKAGSLRLPR